MKITTVSATAILLTLVAPLGWSGSAADPEVFDAQGDAMVGGTYLPGLDILSAWFSTAPSGLRGTPILAPATPAFTLTFQLKDLEHPAADAATNEISYNYRVEYLLDGVQNADECGVFFAAVPEGTKLADGTGAGVGTDCVDRTNRAATATVDVQADRVIMAFGHATSGATLSGIVLTTWSGPADRALENNFKGASATDTAVANDFVAP